MNHSCITQIHLIRSLILRKFRMQFLETKIRVNIFSLILKERKLLHRSSQKLQQHKLLDKPNPSSCVSTGSPTCFYHSIVGFVCFFGGWDCSKMAGLRCNRSYYLKDIRLKDILYQTLINGLKNKWFLSWAERRFIKWGCR